MKPANVGVETADLSEHTRTLIALVQRLVGLEDIVHSLNVIPEVPHLRERQPTNATPMRL